MRTCLTPTQPDVDVSLHLDLPEDAVARAEVDLIEAHLGPLLQQFLFGSSETV